MFEFLIIFPILWLIDTLCIRFYLWWNSDLFLELFTNKKNRDKLRHSLQKFD